jgi:hypothetical protein
MCPSNESSVKIVEKNRIVMNRKLNIPIDTFIKEVINVPAKIATIDNKK